ncbi:ParB/RepB/Spo0J family partition protein [Nakamurella flava]|uniref:ParB/RepB/Spo0J family partition protein n=1 Tax=Nakamurella flava TaxID=2576308 RepID=A0A4U6QAI9_9ACTN|nr:ParB/RepB/Spo0J family partition protein [Nakamurella flava]TKV56984.1 ParB/RepB/Spo0J family partition protein [Nakamurella flava]
MSKSRGGLGRGLAALIPSGPETTTLRDTFFESSSSPSEREPRPPATARATGSRPRPKLAEAFDPTTPTTASLPSSDGPQFRELPVGSIRPNPHNPRDVFDEEALDELAHSLKEFGVLQPIVVRQIGRDQYELVMGERRWRASQRAGLTTIPAIVRRTEDADMLRDALLENIHRANLNPLEEAAAYQQLLEEFDVTQEELASRLGRSRPVISNTIRLLRLPVAVQRRVAAGVLSAGHARALLGLSAAEDQEQLAARIVAEGLSVRGTEEAVTLLNGRAQPRRRPAPKARSVEGLDQIAGSLSDRFDTRVRLEMGRSKGRIIVEFATPDDLHRIMGVMAPESLATLRSGD